MGSLIWIDTDEVFPYAIGPEPEPGIEDDRTILYWSVVRSSRWQQLVNLYTARGKTDIAAYRVAVVATALTGWTRLGRRMPDKTIQDWPWPLSEGRPVSLTPLVMLPAPAQITNGQALGTDPELTQRLEVLKAVEGFPISVVLDLAGMAEAPAPEEVLKNSSALLSANSSLLAQTARATPASIADANAEMPTSLSPATEVD